PIPGPARSAFLLIIALTATAFGFYHLILILLITKIGNKAGGYKFHGTMLTQPSLSQVKKIGTNRSRWAYCEIHETYNLLDRWRRYVCQGCADHENPWCRKCFRHGEGRNHWDSD